MLKNMRWLFIVLTVLAVCLLLVFFIKMPKQPLLVRMAGGFILGGAIGNLIDRLFPGACDRYDLF